MGRTEGERRQAGHARLQAAGITPKKSGGAGRGLVIAGVVLAVAVLAGVYVAWQNYNSSAVPAYAVARDGVVVTAGDPAAPVTVDIYEDYLCPNCKELERYYGGDLTAALNEGKAKINYHHVAILDDRTTPPGYSTRAGNAALCAADAGIFPAYHSRLYTDQPSEGGAGLTVQQLTALGTELGATGDFGGCVTRQESSQAIADATRAAAADPKAAPGGGFGTPTVLVQGTKADLSNGAWLTQVTG
ncbi:putative membrane protein [Pseudonocardia sp. Ae168_Ps1]|uniref:DsbA family protein n=1 Tax=unclassified Pseudonocardia TaxID=2619320 RepID=UPI00094AD072|nr:MULTISPECIES: thioredoxin domain-containing protein [unclassified Pseudonocardia]OLL75901.1 putative membrane protein [Pseudonocardia sp. Ae150A_Ps1]OLL81900.1 putative membrane protein [Pseudonocardia sp. Ae168_Ps1]OLL83987.1 putative membrane protein [Pseudonocardia sp. Ae263_Ps1]OLL95993.1 putative membrane protein [Pseudonocardia sp. Ae356_Ps1]